MPKDDNVTPIYPDTNDPKAILHYILGNLDLSDVTIYTVDKCGQSQVFSSNLDLDYLLLLKFNFEGIVNMVARGENE